jgi:hypothetical protein
MIMWLLIYADVLLTLAAFVWFISFVAALRAVPKGRSYNEVLEERMELAREIARNLESPLRSAAEHAVEVALKPKRNWLNDDD